MLVKKILGVTGHTPNMLVYSELNRYPLSIDSKLKAIKYWFKLLGMTMDRLPRQAYEREKLEINKDNGWGGGTKKNTGNSRVCIYLDKSGNSSHKWIC